MVHISWNILVCLYGQGHAATPAQVHQTFKYCRPGRGDCSINEESYGRSTRAERRRLPRVPEEMLRMRVKSTLQARQEMVQEGTTRDRQTGSGAPGVLRGNFWILSKAYLYGRPRVMVKEGIRQTGIGCPRCPARQILNTVTMKREIHIRDFWLNVKRVMQR